MAMATALEPGAEVDSAAGSADVPRIRCPACFRQFPSDEKLVRHLEKAGHTMHEPQCGACHKHCFCFESLREHILGRLAKKECAAEFSRRGCNLCMTFLESEDALTTHRLQCQFLNPGPAGKVLKPVMEHSRKRIKATPQGSAQTPLFSEECQSEAVALDCEMVGGGKDGSINICARVCLVDEHENVLLNTYVQPVLPVTDYRYEITGIKPTDFNDAPSLKRIRAVVKRILGDKLLLVGHDLRHDLACLNLDYPPELLRDTATYQLLVKTSGVSHKLRYLTEVFLGYKIQDGASHDPCEDAVAAMRLYKRMRSRKHAGTLAHSFDLSQLSLRNGDSPQRSSSRVYTYSAPTFDCWCSDSKDVSVDESAHDYLP
ncbi:hypothetical protein M758_7G081400 [Ceratodon purpureus]|nr:hypothetical protein M758_7G081400 [Ceratodon purpureus]